MRKTWIIIGIAMLLFTSYKILDTYAKYVSRAEAQVEKESGAWVIKVNDTDISNSNEETTFNISNIIYQNNEFVAENKMAPSSNGYFDIIIDPSNSSVAVRFDVTLDVQQLNIIDSIRFTNAYRIINGEESSDGIVQTGENTYSGVINLNDVKNKVASTMRFYIGWDEKETEEGDLQDSELGSVIDLSTDLPVRVTVSQYLGEELN